MYLFSGHFPAVRPIRVLSIKSSSLIHLRVRSNVFSNRNVFGSHTNRTLTDHNEILFDVVSTFDASNPKSYILNIVCEQSTRLRTRGMKKQTVKPHANRL